MSTPLHIQASAGIHGRDVFLNDQLWYAGEHDLEFGAFSKEVYRKLEMNYLKFFKMDNPCKQGVLAAEVLLRSLDSGAFAPHRVGVCLGTRYGSLDTDQRYFDTYQGGPESLPSPGLFVYTLPNILIGELCIRHKFTGEQACFVLDSTQLDCLYLYTENLFETGLVDACLIGWNDYYDTTHSCGFAWIIKGHEGSEGRPFRSEEIADLRVRPDSHV